jgi:hypothetical protein
MRSSIVGEVMLRPCLIAGFFLGAVCAAFPASAETFMPTIYSDGASCPGHCDAHVVFKSVHNGTKYAALPSSPRSAPKACVQGQACRVCFDDSDASCIEAIYRGSGPDPHRFDFTPAFFEATCPKSNIPSALVRACKGFQRKYDELTANAVYCLEQPDFAGCKDVLAKAEAAKAADKPFWDECLALGEDRFNRKYASEPAKQRTDKCTYEQHGTGGPNSNGDTWSRLLPSACPSGTHVDRAGTDCCDGSKITLGGFGKQCDAFLVPKN